ncbi:MAG: calcium/sodium antiporter [Spirochaetota bacterium]
MILVLNASLVIFSIFLLWIGANYLVESAEKIANSFGISELIIGLTVVAFGTSAPEFAVTVSAAINNQASISVGNIVGSNIFNLGFILGSVALIRPVNADKKLVNRDGLFMLATTVILIFFFYTGGYTLSRIEGLLLFCLLIAYIWYLFVKRETIEDDILHEKAAFRDFVIAPVSVVFIILGGNLLVTSATVIAQTVGVPEWLIAVTVVAAGTSAPEMVTSLVAVIKGKHGISAGNLVGSNIFNLLGVLGLAGIIRPLTLHPGAYQSLILLSLLILFAIIFMRTGWKVSRLEGAILIGLGILLWMVDFFGLYVIGVS